MEQTQASSAQNKSTSEEFQLYSNANYYNIFLHLFTNYSDTIFKDGWKNTLGRVESSYEVIQTDFVAGAAWDRIRITLWILSSMSFEQRLNDKGSTYTDLTEVFPEK